MSAFGRIRSCPRVYGTTQKLQNSLQPSMIVTYALTGSLRRATPNGNLASPDGLRAITGTGDFLNPGAGTKTPQSLNGGSTSNGSCPMAWGPTTTPTQHIQRLMM